MSVSKQISSKVLKGWLEIPKRKVSPTLQFFRLRGYVDDDARGPTAPIAGYQLISRHAPTSSISRQLSQLTPESCVAVKVTQALRPESAQRPQDGDAGLYDYEITDLEVFNTAAGLPFLPNAEQGVDNAVRAQHRHIELRSDAMTHNLRERARIKRRLQCELERQGFLEVETPLLFKSTPEGAREFLVPTRKKGQFFALPQSPQQYKQILMAGGVRRYYQFAKCFRDEGGRADRQLEFTQLDLEMSFVNMEDVMAAISKIVLSVDSNDEQETKLFNVDSNGTIPRLKYMDAMRSFGSDKPDLRFGLEIDAIEDESRGDVIDVLRFDCTESDKPWSSKMINAVRDVLKDHNIEVSYHSSSKQNHGPLYKQFSSRFPPSATMSAASNSSLVLITRRPRILSGGSTAMGQARLLLQSHLESLNLVPKRATRPFNLCWITDFPLFTPSSTGDDGPGQSGTSGYAATHHPFTAPHPDDVSQVERGELRSVSGLHYDLVMNGQEIGGGSIRIHNAVLQERVFDVLGMSESRKSQFAHLLRVLSSGCPPHGGFALGLDRFVAMLCGCDSIRQVIAFPKTGSGTDTLIGCPSAVDEETLKEYHIAVRQD